MIIFTLLVGAVSDDGEFLISPPVCSGILHALSVIQLSSQK